MGDGAAGGGDAGFVEDVGRAAEDGGGPVPVVEVGGVGGGGFEDVDEPLVAGGDGTGGAAGVGGEHVAEAVGLGVHDHGLADGAEVGGALDGFGLLAGFGEGGEEDADEDGDDADDDEEFHKSESGVALGREGGVGGKDWGRHFLVLP